MIPKKLAPAKAGVADFSDKITRKIKENREHCRFNVIEKRSKMFRTILIANDGSEPAFHALALALTIAKENGAALHMVSVVEVPYLPETIEEVREETHIE